MSAEIVASWSNVLPAPAHLVGYREGLLRARRPGRPFIPRGAGRSFGDAAYVSGGDTVCSTLGPSFVDVDAEAGTLRAAAGVPLRELHRAAERAGRYLPVFGGTQEVTAAGAVASDIHSKDDAREGSCGNHVEALTLITPDGAAHRCSRDEAPGLFAATVGGMGMTGYIETVTFRLLPARPLTVRIRGRRFHDVAGMMALFDGSTADFQVTEWVDLTRARPEGIVWTASYVEGAPPAEPPPPRALWLPRVCAFNRVTVRLLERVTLEAADRVDFVAHRRRFNYGSAHEALLHYNRLFGARGFIEYHFCVPGPRFEEAFSRLVETGRRRAVPLFFGAGKRFGDATRAGMISFPAPGFGMNFQTPDDPEHRRFLVDFGDALIPLGGRVYLAKDAVATPSQVRRMYPRIDAWQAILRRHDPRKEVMSNLARRLELKPW